MQERLKNYLILRPNNLIVKFISKSRNVNCCFILGISLNQEFYVSLTQSKLKTFNSTEEKVISNHLLIINILICQYLAKVLNRPHLYGSSYASNYFFKRLEHSPSLTLRKDCDSVIEIQEKSFARIANRVIINHLSIVKLIEDSL